LDGRSWGISKASEDPYKHGKWSKVMGNGMYDDENDAEVKNGHV